MADAYPPPESNGDKSLFEFIFECLEDKYNSVLQSVDFLELLNNISKRGMSCLAC